MLFKRSLLAVSAIALMAVFSHAEVTYTLHKSANPTADEQDAYKRITTVMDSAVKLYNTYSNLSKFINVYYAPGVPTAEASSNGDLRFGENRSYMVVPTAMHEMGHTMGIGTTQEYWDVCKDGVFRNDKVQAKLRELDNDPTKELHCDSQHIWPYGLNQASEAKSEKDLINHVILVETIYQQLFKVAFFKEGRIKSLSERKCMGITADNALELMDCSDTATFVKIFSVGDNPVTYYIQLGNRVVDIPNESTAAGIVASTYGYNGGAHQRYTFDDAGINTSNAFLLKNYKSGLYLQAVGTQVQQNRKVDRDESFIWQLEEAGTKPDTSSAGDTSVVDTGKVVPKDTTGDTSSVKIVRLRDTRVDMAPARTFDLKGRCVNRHPLGRNRNNHTVVFGK